MLQPDPRKTGPYVGDGVLVDFDFGFKVFTSADILVTVYLDADGLEHQLVLGTDYTVALNPDQDAAPGGTVTLIGTYAATPLTAGDVLVISGALPLEQPLDINNGDGYHAQTQENAFDRCVMLIQQVDEKVGRALLAPITETAASPEALVLQLQAAANQVATTYDAFDDRYLGAKAADPTTDNDSGVLSAGALYFNTGTVQMRVWDAAGTVWRNITGGYVKRESQALVGANSITLAAITYVPGTDTVAVFVDGTRYFDITETSATVITFAAPQTGTVVVETINTSTGGIPSSNVGVTPTGVLTSDNLQDALAEIAVDSGEAVKGLVEKATTAEAQARATGKFLDGERGGEMVDYTFTGTGKRSLAADGYQVLPGGLILQWGYVNGLAGNSSTDVTLPKAYTTAHLLAMATVSSLGSNTSSNQNASTGAEALSITQIRVRNGLGAVQSLRWFSLGY